MIQEIRISEVLIMTMLMPSSESAGVSSSLSTRYCSATRPWADSAMCASTSAGVELDNHEIVVLGMSAQWGGPLRVDHAVMADAVDTAPVRAALTRLGLADDVSADGRLVALLAKAEPGSTGRLRGKRHTMLDDSDISATRHARAFVGGVLAGLVGTSEIFVSGGAEHQGPDGGGPVALIAERATGARV